MPAPRWQESFVTSSDGTRLYVRATEASSAAALSRGAARLSALLCDGIACDGFVWRYLADELTASVDVTHWNYRGHGRSHAPADPDRVGMSALVDDLEAVRAAKVHGPVVLFGHSMGCQVALEGYRRRRDGIAGLVLICGAPGRVTHTFRGSDALARALPGLIERVERHPQLARALWSNLPPATATRVALATGEVAAGVDPAALMPYMEHAVNLDLRMFLRMLRSVGDDTAEDLLAAIDVPVLILAGERDTFTPPERAERMAAAIPGAELVVLPGTTHIVPLERRDDVREKITSFLRERVAARLTASE